MQHVIAAAAQAVPGYCTSGHGVLTPAQWQTCWKLGWNEPVTGAANAGFLAGKSGGATIAVLVAAVIVFLVARALIASGTRGTAASRS